MAVFQVFLTIMLLQIRLFKQYLTVEQPNPCNYKNQKNPIREYQELAKQDQRKRRINGIAAISKNAAGDQFIGVFRINTNPKTLPKRNQAP
jgi:hypothetical protein